MKTDIRYFCKAKHVAHASDYPKIHIGCVAVYQGSIIGIGCNTNKTHPIQKYYNSYRSDNENFDDTVSLLPKLHAEINCINSIRHMNINFAKVKLYIYRLRNDDMPYGISRPCPSCMAAIKNLGIREIHYTTNDGFVTEFLDNKYI